MQGVTLGGNWEKVTWIPRSLISYNSCESTMVFNKQKEFLKAS